MAALTAPAGTPGRRPGWTAWVVIMVVLGGVAAAWWLQPGSAEPATPARADRATLAASAASLLLNERTMGDSAAPLVIFEFSDFQCPFCRVFWEETMPALEREYVRTGKVRIVFANYPIPEIHRNSSRAHEHAMCAAAQRKFWPYHDLLFRHQAAWSGLAAPDPFFRALGDSAGLAAGARDECLEAGAVRRIIDGDVQSAGEIGVSSTPSFLVGRLLIRGTIPIEEWRPVLDSIHATRTTIN